MAEAELVDVRWHADDPLSGELFTVAPVESSDDLDGEDIAGRWIELVYQAADSAEDSSDDDDAELITLTVNLSDEPARGLDGWGYRVTAS